MGATAGFSLFLVAQASAQSSPGSLGWAGRVFTRRSRSWDCDEAFECLVRILMLLFVGLVFVRVGRATWSKNGDYGRHDIFYAPPLWYDMVYLAPPLPRSPIVEVCLLSPRSLSTMYPKPAPGFPGCVVQPRTCHFKWGSSQIGLRSPPTKGFQNFVF